MAGKEASKAMLELVQGHKITCEARVTGRYGRSVALCRADGRDLGAAMASAGMAWAFTRYSSDYVEQEKAAIGAKLGVHKHDCQKPWDWRARSRGDRMIKRKPNGQKEVPVQWIDICRVLRMMGCMKDLSKAESMRIVSLLKERIAAGTAKKLCRGEYTAVWPQEMRATAKSAPPATTAGKGRSAKVAGGSRRDK